MSTAPTHRPATDGAITTNPQPARRTRRRGLALFAVATLLLATLAITAGCSDSDSDDGALAQDASAVTGVTTVQMRNNKFVPPVIEVPIGTTVTWEFTDGSTVHNVVGEGFSSPTQSKGTFAHTFSQAGSYAYRCTLHDGMHGQVIVK
jgi:plastocyanin